MNEQESRESNLSDQYLRQVSVELAVKLTLKDEALFAGGMIDYANRIYQFIKDGTLIDHP